jgi:hypothetical protein
MICSRMKKASKILVIGLLFAGSLYGQAFIATEEETREIVPVAPSQQRPTIEGIVKEVFTTKPWQLVNPAAPAQYGSGRRMVSKDFGAGTPFHSTGLIVASVEW